MATTSNHLRFKRPSEACVFEPAQWNLLMHIFETFVPKLTPEETAKLIKHYRETETFNPVSDEVLEAYAQESSVDNPIFVEDVDLVFQKHVPADKVAEFKTALNIMDTRLGSLVFTGSTIPFYQRTREEREQIVYGWSVGRMTALKKLFKSVSIIAKNYYCRSNENFHAAAGFPNYPFTKEAEEDLKQTLASASTSESNPEYKFEDLSQVAQSADGTIKLSTSILIIGSGCGGGVVAGHLSNALPHHSLMVIEKGFWYPKHKQPLTERDGMKKLYEESGALQTSDGGMIMMAGSNWGGGSTINWGVSWQLTGRIRKEWAEKYGLKFAVTPEFQECMDYVSKVGHAKAFKEHEHNASNAAVMEGSHRLGERCISVPQNIQGDPDAHSKICGAFCTVSCKGSGIDAPGGGGKMATTKTYLATARENGAKFIQGFEVEKITFDRNGNTTGVEGLWRASDNEVLGTGRKVVITAKKVICSGGSLNTPAILQRSGLRNWWIGRNLHLHPAAVCASEWKKETRPWEGPIISAANNEYDSLDNNNHGAVIEGMLMLPGIGLLCLPWRNALEYRQTILRFKHMTNHVIICRDRDTGRIIADSKSNKFSIEYTPSEFDKKNLLDALIGAIKMLRAAGAVKIFPPIINGPIYIKHDDKDEDDKIFEQFVADVRREGFFTPKSSIGCAHQMGSCRMGISPRQGACDPKGKIWERNGLYVADASLMPTSSGVNPMITTQALAEYVSRGIVADVLREEAKSKL